MGIHHREHRGHREDRSLVEEKHQYPHKEITERVIRAAIEVHRALGPGLLETAYEACLADELLRSNIGFVRQLELPIEYKGRRVEAAYRIDFLVEDQVILELKSVDKILPIHEAQLLTYLRLAEKRTGLLINFNMRTLRDGLVRRVL